MTLRQFGFPTSEEWRGDQRSYIIAQIEYGEDQKLGDLDAYLYPDSSLPTEPTLVLD